MDYDFSSTNSMDLVGRRQSESSSDSAYVRDEDNAKAGRKGMWRGEFMMPWDWRRR